MQTKQQQQNTPQYILATNTVFLSAMYREWLF